MLVVAQSYSYAGIDTKVITGYIAGNKANIVIGFQDSSFSYDPNQTFCFIGRVSDVCKIVKASELKMGAEYSQGAHDYMIVKSCEIVDPDPERIPAVVKTVYSLRDDYTGGIDDVERTIARCTKF